MKSNLLSTRELRYRPKHLRRWYDPAWLTKPRISKLNRKSSHSSASDQADLSPRIGLMDESKWDLFTFGPTKEAAPSPDDFVRRDDQHDGTENAIKFLCQMPFGIVWLGGGSFRAGTGRQTLSFAPQSVISNPYQVLLQLEEAVTAVDVYFRVADCSGVAPMGRPSYPSKRFTQISKNRQRVTKRVKTRA